MMVKAKSILVRLLIRKPIISLLTTATYFRYEQQQSSCQPNNSTYIGCFDATSIRRRELSHASRSEEGQ